MFTLYEKMYLLKLLKQKKRFFWFSRKKQEQTHQILIGKLEQMIRNEQVNEQHLNRS